jgi:hypothetical protein
VKILFFDFAVTDAAAIEKHLYLWPVIGHSAGQLHPLRNGRTARLAHAACLELADLGRDPD